MQVTAAVADSGPRLGDDSEKTAGGGATKGRWTREKGPGPGAFKFAGDCRDSPPGSDQWQRGAGRPSQPGLVSVPPVRVDPDSELVSGTAQVSPGLFSVLPAHRRAGRGSALERSAHGAAASRRQVLAS